MIGRWALLVLALSGGCGTTTPISDAAVVHCVSHRSETVDAAAALGLVDSTSIGNRILLDGTPVEFDEWRRTRQPEFEKACKAAAEPHMQPAPASTPSWIVPTITAAVGLLSTALGWWISWVTTNRREDRNRAKEHSVELRKAGREFADEVRDYCEAQLKERASPAELRRKRDLLNTQLAVTKLMRPDWSAPDVLRTELDAFGTSVEEGWDFENDRNERRPRIAEVTEAARTLDRRIEVVVQALRRPGDASALLDDEFGQVVSA
ncbi:hypothetical protein ABZX92_23810 [Lentzea sp. NPDC006480]|uniref:hypothetical protein n=1 Tax=Lentzea sp. NPDC006480 TaxID=3157176 RepID=UPI00339EC22A